MDPIKNKKIAECVGLWLAEGDNKSKSEITFTNSCIPLLDLFKDTLNKLFKDFSYNQRVYVYSRNGEKINLGYKNCVFKYYIHKRATKPYFIFRIASAYLIKEWRKIVDELLNEKDLYQHILRGFFAGEGNIHGGKRGVRVLRISQKEKKDFIDNLLNHLNMIYSFTQSNRNYVISSKYNWDIFAKYKIADLHPQKKEKFWRFYNSFKEEHYQKNYLKSKIQEMIENRFTAKQLASKLNRSQSRVSEVLVNLKKEGKAINYRIRNKDYWINNKNLILISSVKANYLTFLTQKRKTSEFAKHFNVDWKSSFNRLKELEKLNLVGRGEKAKWKRKSTEKRIIAI